MAPSSGGWHGRKYRPFGFAIVSEHFRTLDLCDRQAADVLPIRASGLGAGHLKRSFAACVEDPRKVRWGVDVEWGSRGEELIAIDHDSFAWLEGNRLEDRGRTRREAGPIRCRVEGREGKCHLQIDSNVSFVSVPDVEMRTVVAAQDAVIGVAEITTHEAASVTEEASSPAEINRGVDQRNPARRRAQ